MRSDTAAERARRGAAGEGPGGADAERGRETWDRGLGEADALRAGVAGRRDLRWLEPIVVSEVIEPMQAMRDRARGAAPSSDVVRRGEEAFALLELLQRVLAERADSEAASRLAEADALLEASHAPLRAYADAEGLSLRGRRVLALRPPLPAAVARAQTRRDARGWTRELWLIPVPFSFGSQFDDYFQLLQELGRRWYFALTELPFECQNRLDLASRVRLPDSRRAYDENSVRACFGPWLPALFADTALTLSLGAGYASALGRRLRRTSQPTAASAEGAFLGGEPPPLLRLHAASSALSARAQHADAERQQQQFRAAFPDLERSTLPLSDGRSFVLPSAYLLALCDRVVQFFRTERLAALGGVPLVEIDGLLQPSERAHEQNRLAELLPRQLPSEPKDPAHLFGATSLALDRGTDPKRALTQFQAAVSPRHPAAPAPQATADQAPTSLPQALRDRSFVLRAAALGAIFEPPRGARASFAQPARRARP